ncbi:hypothetical protein PENTCL1PPCAC_27864, partial [Pristionchus entomophagus]
FRMRPSLLLLLLFSPSIALAASTKDQCNYVTLVRCFIQILDEWAWTLYELKDNVVTITSDQCVHLRELDKCVKDDFQGTGQSHKCTHTEVVEASNTVSDLLTHRKNSGSFLKSYYLLTYACSPEGQTVLSTHRECLRKEKIGEMTLAAGTYLTEKFLDEGDDEVCDNVQAKLNEYVESMSGLCKNEAADIMCQSLIHMFQGLHADKLSECELKCPTIENPTEEPAVNEGNIEEGKEKAMGEIATEIPQEIPSEPDAQQGPAKAANSAALASTLSFIVAGVLFR